MRVITPNSLIRTALVKHVEDVAAMIVHNICDGPAVVTVLQTGERVRQPSRFWLNQQVVTTKNIDPSRGIINGALATIVALTDHAIHARLRISNEVSDAGYLECKDLFAHNKTLVMASFHSIPIKQAHVSAVYSCQRLTLGKVILDIQDPYFEHGMFYTSITRVKKLEDITVLGEAAELKYVSNLELLGLADTVLDDEALPGLEWQDAPRTATEVYRIGI